MTFRFFLTKLLLVIAGVSTGLGVGIGCYQAYYWLWRGVSLRISTLDAFIYVDEHLISMGQLPVEGFRLLEAAPLALLLLILGVLLLLLSRFIAQVKQY